VSKGSAVTHKQNSWSSNPCRKYPVAPQASHGMFRSTGKNACPTAHRRGQARPIIAIYLTYLCAPLIGLGERAAVYVPDPERGVECELITIPQTLEDVSEATTQFGRVRNARRVATMPVQPAQPPEFGGVRPDDESPVSKRHLANMHPPFTTPTAKCRRRHLSFQGQLLQPLLVRLVEARVDGSIPMRPSGETLAREHQPHGPHVECVPAMR
jgi:hypothetical protein